MQSLGSKDRIAFGLSVAVIVFTILAITFFILYGGGALFYGTALIAIVFGFAMAYFVSKVEVKATPAETGKAASTTQKSKRRKKAS